MRPPFLLTGAHRFVIFRARWRTRPNWSVAVNRRDLSFLRGLTAYHAKWSIRWAAASGFGFFAFTRVFSDGRHSDDGRRRVSTADPNWLRTSTRRCLKPVRRLTP